MRISINLATQPYQDVRQFAFRWALALFAMALLTGALLYAAVANVIAWRATKGEIASRQAAIAQRDQERAKAEAFLNLPQNRDTKLRGDFLNDLIARKAFSWTQAFSELEKLMPARLHVTALRPITNEKSQLELHLTVIGSARADAIELVRRLETSPHFTGAKVLSESLVPSGAAAAPGSVQFEISAVYVPKFAATEVASGRP
jgi:type IV pilus assembly protein PilN